MNVCGLILSKLTWPAIDTSYLYIIINSVQLNYIWLVFYVFFANKMELTTQPTVVVNDPIKRGVVFIGLGFSTCRITTFFPLTLMKTFDVRIFKHIFKSNVKL